MPESSDESSGSTPRDQFLRAKAELANYRKRVERDQAASAAAMKRSFLEGFLPALDAMDLAIKHAESDPGGLLGGIKAARDAFEKAVAAEGAERITAEPGTGYDPRLHHAHAMVERADLPEGVIVEELRPGYRIGKLVVRHGLVTVSKRKQSTDERGSP